MIFILLAILSSSLNVILFKLFEKHDISSIQAIIFNYFTCVLAGYLVMDKSLAIEQSVVLSWVPYAVIVGSVFILSFYLIAETTQRNGVSVAAVANKLAMVIPIIFALLFYENETLTAYKFFGILLAILAVLATSIQLGSESNLKGYLWLPLSVFILGGSIDTLIAFLETQVLGKGHEAPFLILTFGVAALIGLGILLYSVYTEKIKLSLKNVLAGLLLGFPNYGSIYFFLKALRHSKLEQSELFPIVNIGVIVFASTVAYLFLSERPTRLNVAGILMALVAIFLISWERIISAS